MKTMRLSASFVYFGVKPTNTLWSAMRGNTVRIEFPVTPQLPADQSHQRNL